MNFTGKTLIITGASEGIGAELALQLAPFKTNLALAARNAARLETVAGECRELGAQVLVVPTDVGDKSACENLVQQTVDAFGGVDVLVNNAGISMWARFDEIENLDIFETIMRVNYLGSVYCTYFALPYLKKSAGLVVGVSSLTGKTGVPTRSGYAASKHAMAGFFDSLRIELHGAGVNVTVIYPGFVASQVRKRALGADARSIGKSPLDETNVMPVEICVQQMVKAMAGRRRELVMTPRGKIGLWLKLVAPKWVDNIARRAVEK